MPSRPTVIALLALFAALAGTATAAKLINGKDIRKGTVASRQIKDGSLRKSDLHRRTIAALRQRLDRIGSAQIADGAVALADLAPGSVDGTRVVDRSLTAGDLVADTITSTELGTGSVGAAELGAKAVGNSEIKGNAISGNHIRPTVLRTGRVNHDFPPVPADDCVTHDFAGSQHAIPDDALAGAVISVGTPGGVTWPEHLLVSGRSPDGETLRVQLCNPTGTAIDPAAEDFPFAAIGT